MKTITRSVLILAATVLASLGACAQKKDAAESRQTETRPAKVTFTFNDAALGVTPTGFAVAETKGAGTPAKWTIEAVKDDLKRKHAIRVETSNKEGVFNLLLSEGSYGPDVELSVDIRPASGEEDQGGGLVWRAKDANNYYVTRWNPLEKNIRVYKVEGGLRTMFKSAELAADPKKWHRIGAVQNGAKMTVTFDGKEVLAAEDATFNGAGKIGLWTKADASSWFDELTVTATRSAPPR
jgi:hypothetical protein